MNVNHVAIDQNHQINDQMSFKFTNRHPSLATDEYAKDQENIHGGGDTYEQIANTGDLTTTLAVDNDENRVKLMVKNTKTGQSDIQEFIYQPKHSGGGAWADTALAGSAPSLAAIEKAGDRVEIQVGDLKFDLRAEYGGIDGDVFSVKTILGSAYTEVRAMNGGSDPKDAASLKVQVAPELQGASILETHMSADAKILEKVLKLEKAFEEENDGAVFDVLNTIKAPSDGTAPKEGKYIAAMYKTQDETGRPLSDEFTSHLGDGDYGANQDGNKAGYATALLNHGGDSAGHRAYMEIEKQIESINANEKAILNLVENLDGEGRQALKEIWQGSKGYALTDSWLMRWTLNDAEMAKLKAMLPGE